MRRAQAGQTTTEFLMISGLMTTVAIFILRFVWAPALPLFGCPLTIQCILQSVVNTIINDPP
jgi:hypothetical protein